MSAPSEVGNMQMQQQLAQVSRHVIGLNYTERNAQADGESVGEGQEEGESELIEKFLSVHYDRQCHNPRLQQQQQQQQLTHSLPSSSALSVPPPHTS